MAKLFNHYKNKPYKYIGLAKHSETLEDMVVYETRYQNQLGKIWVRPKSMFFESIEVDGKLTPRFREIEVEIQAKTEIAETELQAIAAIMQKAFGEWDAKWFGSTFRNHTRFFLLTAFIEGQPVAFKIGYETGSGVFYSWLGGVVPELRGLGLAADLMQRQHQWCIENGYLKIQTKTQNRFRDMLLLNIRFGFEIVGYHNSDEGGPKVVLEKKLLSRE